MIHLSDPMAADDDGFLTPRCSCGWTCGAVPDPETATDVLMEHAYNAGFQEGASQDNPPARPSEKG